MHETTNLAPTASLSRSCSDRDDPLTRFEAQFTTAVDEREVQVGTLNGWFLSSTTSEELADWSFAAGPDAEDIGAVAAEILDDPTAYWLPPSGAMLIDRMYLEPEYRGRNLARVMAESFAALIGIDRHGCVVTTFPAPPAADGRGHEDDGEGTRAREALTLSLERQGFDRWRQSGVCWTVLGVDRGALD